MKKICPGLLVAGSVVLAVVAGAETGAGSPVPTDGEIHKILVQRIDVEHQSVGIVVGVVDSAGRSVTSYGSLENGDSRPLNGDTIFEIGSVSKVFTALILCEMVRHGDVALSDPVRKFLPEGVTMPTRNGHEITLQDLATHTSGLPRLPGNLSIKNPSDPYADYTVGDLYKFLSSYTLPRDPGSTYEYSNLGGGLLGHVLSRKAGMDYESLLTSRICRPLGMTGTAIAISDDATSHFAVGHDEKMKAVPHWTLPTLAGAGAIRSTANDLLTFLEANLGLRDSTLKPAMAAMLAVRRPTGAAGLEIALGWHVFTRNGDEIVWHNGGTGGFHSFVGFRPRSRAGVVVLSNAGTSAGIDDIGLHILDASLPLLAAPRQHKEISVDPKLFDGYVGRYELTPTFVMVITLEGGHLFVQATGQPKFEIFAEGGRDFFLKVVDAQITFEADDSGRATALVLHQNGRDQRAKKIE